MFKKWIYFLPLVLSAQPHGGKAVSGTAEFSHQGSHCHVHASDRAVIHWDQFGVGQGETLSFIQPGSNSSVLNRVTGQTISEINGLLQANGRVFLINPNGILIGPEGMIQTGGFLASTLDLIANPFDPERPLGFEGKEGSLTNLGYIRGEEWVCLISPNIVNKGTIEGGSVAMASSHSVLVRPRSNETIWVEIQESKGTNPFSQAINLNGTVRANSLSCEGGEIVLKAELISIEGKMEAPGNSISILGRNIELSDTSCLSVSGIDSQSSGDILIRASESLAFSGTIEAKGGLHGGDGGFVEVSGKTLLFQGIVDRIAPQGSAGTLLIDPSDILITTATSGNITFAANTYSVNAALPTPATIDATAIGVNLGLGPVTVTTSSGFGDVGNITITSPISWGTGFPLTLLADGSITLQNVIIANVGAATTTLTAQNSITLDASSVSSSTGDIFVTATTGSLNLLGTVAGSAVIATFGGDIFVNAGQDVNLINNGDPMATEVIIGVLPGGGSTSITAGRDILLSNPAFATTPNPAGIGGSNILTLTAGRDITLQNQGCFAVAAFGDFDITAGRNLSLGFNAGLFVFNTASTITIVTDNQAPSAPQVGDGGLLMNPLSVIGFIPGGSTPPVNIRIYTARPSQNSIALLNWTSFVHDPSQVDTATEVYGVYFPSGIPITSPLQYIVFYKTVDVPSSVLTQQVPQVLSSGFETLRRFSYRHPYSLLNQVERFWTLHEGADPLLNRTFYPIYLNNYREFTP